MFEYAYGSVRGKHHLQHFLNNQDSFYLAEHGTEDLMVGVVTDGCGSCEKSEVGAILGARSFSAQTLRFINEAIQNDWEEKAIIDAIPLMVGRRMLASLRALNMSFQLEEEKIGTLWQYTLFTIIGFVKFRNNLIFVACGDGVIRVNGEVIYDPDFEGNAPNYLAYRAFPKDYDVNADLENIAVYKVEDVQNFEIATDGIHHLPMKIEEFLKDIPFSANPFAANGLELPLRRLAGGVPKVKVVDDEEKVNGVTTQLVQNNTVLVDDTTIIAGKKV